MVPPLLANPFVQISLICIGMLLVIVAYGTFRCKSPNFHDPLTGSLVPPPWDRFLDGWGISHFMFYGILAFMFPSWPHLICIACIGIAWEVIESIFHDHPFYLSKCHYSLDSDATAGWWYGRWQDIVMNSLGMIVGVSLRYQLGRK